MQTSAGVDFINEGELTKGGHWTQYLAARLGGYEPRRRAWRPRQAADVERRLGRLRRRSTSRSSRTARCSSSRGRPRTCRRGPRTASPSSRTGCAPGRSPSAATQALDREIAMLTGRARRPAGVRRVPDHDGAPQRRARPHERVLQVRRGAHLRDRRGDAGRVRGDRRSRVPGPGRRCLARRAVGPDRARDGARRLPQVLRDALRGAEPRAAQHPRGADPVPPVLGKLARTALARSAVARRHRHHAVDQGADLLHRGRQRAPRARGRRCGRTPSCPTARSSRRAS